MERYITMLEEILLSPYMKTYHHCTANDGMLSWEWDHTIFNGHIGHPILSSSHIAQVSNMPNIKTASGG